MRFSIRPTAAVRQAFARRYASTEAQNPQVKNAVESASKAYDNAIGTAKRVAGPLGERAGNMLGGYKDPLVYNFKVFTSLCRQVYIAEKLAPPTSLSAWVNAFGQLSSRAVSASYWKGLAQSGEWAKVGIYGLEVYGIYKIGEIIGRRNLVGYKLQE